VVTSTTAVLTLSTFRAIRSLLVADGPLGVLLGHQTFDPLGQLALPILPHIWTGPSQVQIALVLERLGGGAVGDPLLRCWARSSTTITAARPPVIHTGCPRRPCIRAWGIGAERSPTVSTGRPRVADLPSTGRMPVHE
jgi:hypothetical protein